MFSPEIKVGHDAESLRQEAVVSVATLRDRTQVESDRFAFRNSERCFAKVGDVLGADRVDADGVATSGCDWHDRHAERFSTVGTAREPIQNLVEASVARDADDGIKLVQV